MPPVLRVARVSPERAGSNSPNLLASRNGVHELGYVEGNNLAIDAWWGEGSSERLDQMAGDIVRARPDVIVTGSGFAVLPMGRFCAPPCYRCGRSFTTLSLKRVSGGTWTETMGRGILLTILYALSILAIGLPVTAALLSA